MTKWLIVPTREISRKARSARSTLAGVAVALLIPVFTYLIVHRGTEAGGLLLFVFCRYHEGQFRVLQVSASRTLIHRCGAPATSSARMCGLIVTPPMVEQRRDADACVVVQVGFEPTMVGL